MREEIAAARRKSCTGDREREWREEELKRERSDELCSSPRTRRKERAEDESHDRTKKKTVHPYRHSAGRRIHRYPERHRRKEERV